MPIKSSKRAPDDLSFRKFTTTILKLIVVQFIVFASIDVIEFSLRKYTLSRYPQSTLPVSSVPRQIHYGGRAAHLILNLIDFLRTKVNIQSFLPIPSPPPLYTLLPSYDFIVIGAGSAGALIAGRLADFNVTVLQLEAGGPAIDGLLSPELLPVGAILNQNTARDWKYRTEPQKSACLIQPNRTSFWPRGKMLGGTSVFNFMIYHKGHPSDFDLWATCLEDERWNSTSVAPRLQALETAFLPHLQEDRMTLFPRGQMGPIPVSRKSPLPFLSSQFLKAAKRDIIVYSGDYSFRKQALGFENATEYNSGLLTPGAGPLEFNKHPIHGQRVTPYRAYVHKQRKRGLLHVVQFSHVTKIGISQEQPLRAETVEFVLAPPSLTDHLTSEQLNKLQRVTVRSTKEIIVSAGSIGTPQLLMLSGIGPKEHLKNVSSSEDSIDLKVDLPGVGSNLMDHIFFPAMFAAKDTRAISSELVSISNAFTPSALTNYLLKGEGMLSSPGADAQLAVPHLEHLGPKLLPDFCHPSHATKAKELMFSQPDLQVLVYGGVPDIWEMRGKMNIALDTPLRFGTPKHWGVSGIKAKLYYQLLKNNKLEESLANFGTKLKMIMLVPVLLHPGSRGKIRLKTRNPFDHPLIDPDYLSHPRDPMGVVEGKVHNQTNFVLGMKLARRLMKTKEWNKVAEAFMEPICPTINNTSIHPATMNTDDDDFEIPADQAELCRRYGPDSDEFLRLQTLTLYHPAGTCRMGRADDPKACVDSSLRVRGIKGLRVADASVLPTLTSGNTQVPVMMIAESLVRMLEEEHKLTI